MNSYPPFIYDLSQYLVKPKSIETTVKIWFWVNDSEFRCFLSDDSCEVHDELPELANQFCFDPWNSSSFSKWGIKEENGVDHEGDPIKTITIDKEGFVKFFKKFPVCLEC